jgi:dipeptidyl aminopeptidase/acylaminoacyl peptidase
MTMRPRATMGIILAALASAASAGAAEPLLHRFLATAISPDGETVASVEGDSPASGAPPALRDLVIRRTDGGGAVTVPLPCAGEPECWPASPAWSPDGSRLAFALRRPGSHARSVYIMGPDGRDPRKLLDFDGTVTALRYLADGRLAMLATAGALKEVGATEAGAPLTGDLSGPPSEQRIAVWDGTALAYASPPNLFVYEYDTVPGGGFVGTAAPGDGDNNWWVAKLYAFSGGAARVIYAPVDGRQQLAAPQVSPDGRTVAFIGGLMSDFGSTGGDVFSVALVGGAATDITPGLRASATAIGWGCDGSLLARLLEGEATQIARLGGGGAGPSVLWSGEETLSGDKAGLSLACRSAVTATVHESFTTAPEIEVGPIGAWRDLTRANRGLTAPVQVKSLTWKTEGQTVQGWLLLPMDAPKPGAGGRAGAYPLITQVHGGPAAAWTPAFVGVGLNRALLDRGYALFRPNPRGSFGQGEAFTQGNVRDLGHGDLKDILAGVDAAEMAAPIDEARLGLTGGSYGGFMTMWAVTQTARFKVGVAAAGISDWLSYYGENGIDQWMIPYFGKSAYDDPAIYARSSPITFITQVRTPVFAYVGANDVECPPPQTQEFWHALRDLGVPTGIAIYPGEGHGLRDAAHAADAERRTLEWFAKYLR